MNARGRVKIIYVRGYIYIFFFLVRGENFPRTRRFVVAAAADAAVVDYFIYVCQRYDQCRSAGQ